MAGSYSFSDTKIRAILEFKTSVLLTERQSASAIMSTSLQANEKMSFVFDTLQLTVIKLKTAGFLCYKLLTVIVYVLFLKS